MAAIFFSTVVRMNELTDTCTPIHSGVHHNNSIGDISASARASLILRIV